VHSRERKNLIKLEGTEMTVFLARFWYHQTRILIRMKLVCYGSFGMKTNPSLCFTKKKMVSLQHTALYMFHVKRQQKENDGHLIKKQPLCIFLGVKLLKSKALCTYYTFRRNMSSKKLR